MNLFKKKKYVPLTPANRYVSPNEEPIIPDGLWVKCPCCGRTVYKKELNDYKICPNCNGYFRLTAWQRIQLTADEESFVEMDGDMRPGNPLGFPGYSEKMQALQEVTGINDAVVCGRCLIESHPVYLCVMDSSFMMGSMGSVVGEKITRIFERATAERMPVIVFTVSGGARMQEGIISLMQMAKISSALARHSKEGLLYISVITDPTTGGVTASFAMLGDIILAEPSATIGFAGRRVIEQTIKETLPEEFQKAEFVLEHGFIDKIAPRPQMRSVLGAILNLHKDNG